MCVHAIIIVNEIVIENTPKPFYDSQQLQSVLCACMQQTTAFEEMRNNRVIAQIRDKYKNRKE
jgi:hypothetical protein